MNKKILVGVFALVTLLGLVGCGSEKKEAPKSGEKKEITVGVTAGSSEEVLEFVAKEAEKNGLKINIRSFSDYVTPDTALANGEIDLNTYQHQPFLDAFNEKNNGKLISIAKTYLAPLGLYSSKYKNVKDIPEGAKIAIPNDPSNGGRALNLLQKQGWIKLTPGKKETKMTVQDIVANPKKLNIVELEAAQLPRSLEDTHASVINAGYAISAGLNSQKDSIAVEDNTSPFVNIVAARPEDKDNPTYKKFVSIFQSPAVKKFIEEKYAGALVPSWK